MPIKFVSFPGFEQWPTLAPGSARWVENSKGETAGLNFSCPGGCGDVATCSVRPIGEPKAAGSGPSWEWNGDEEKPTLTPSILSAIDRGGCGWHGYLTDGIFKVLSGPGDQCRGRRVAGS